MSITNKNQLAYLAFGPKSYQIEAFYSIVTALNKSLSTPELKFDINVYTDTPEFYSNLPVETHNIKSEWYGPHNYHFRVKHAIMLDSLHKYQKSCFIDTDTFFMESPKFLFDRINSNTILCNSKLDTKLSSLDSLVATVCADRKLLENNFVYLNSGVIGLTQGSIGVLETSISLMDELYPDLSHYYTLEELTLAIAANLTGKKTTECTDVIHHYWSRKLIFRKKAEAWYLKHHTSPLNSSAFMDSSLVTTTIPKPPPLVNLKNKIIASLFMPNQKQFYLELARANHQYKNEFDHYASKAWVEKAIENLFIKNSNLTEDQANKIINSICTRLTLKKLLPLIHQEYKKVQLQREATTTSKED